MWIIFLWNIGIVALILGISSRKRIEQDPNLEGSGMALAGIVMGSIAIGIWALILIIYIFVIFGIALA